MHDIERDTTVPKVVLGEMKMHGIERDTVYREITVYNIQFWLKCQLDWSQKLSTYSA